MRVLHRIDQSVLKVGAVLFVCNSHHIKVNLYKGVSKVKEINIV